MLSHLNAHSRPMKPPRRRLRHVQVQHLRQAFPRLLRRLCHAWVEDSTPLGEQGSQPLEEHGSPPLGDPGLLLAAQWRRMTAPVAAVGGGMGLRP